MRHVHIPTFVGVDYSRWNELAALALAVALVLLVCL
jgi:hypothetical protein